MYFIILGHFFPKNFEYIYTFNVPLFFIISGFLSKHESDNKRFWKKIFLNLIVPMLLACLINYLYDIYVLIKSHTYINTSSTLNHIIGITIGNQKNLGACWYIYSLIIIKVIYQISSFSNEKIHSTTILIITIALSVYLNKKQYFLYNSFANACIAYPFFFIGLSLRGIKKSLGSNTLHKRHFLLLVIMLSVSIVCQLYNGRVWMFKNDFGGNYLLYIFGGISGTTSIYIISRWLSTIIYPKFVKDISIGGILILGLHFNLIRYIRQIVPYDYAAALILLLSFVPIINCCKRYFPYAIGVFRSQDRKNNKG